MRRNPSIWRKVALAVASVLLGNVSAEQVYFGFTGPLSGASGQFGQQLTSGIRLGFSRFNAQSDLPYQLSLIARDDGYEPDKTPDLVKHLVEENRVIGLVGSVGTPTTISTLPILKHYQLPLVSPITGSSLLKQDDLQSLIFTHRPNYHDEAQQLVEYVAGNLAISPKDMAVYIQKDSYGEVTLRSLTDALKSYGLNHANDLLQIHYVRNHPHTEQAVAQVLSQPSPPKAIFLISTFPAASELIRMLDKVGISPLFAAFSFVSHETLNEQLKHTKARVLSTQLHPCLDDTSSPIIKEFLDDLKSLSPSTRATSVVLEGYMAARYIEQALIASKLTSPPTRQEFHQALIDYERSHKTDQNRTKPKIEMGQNKSGIWLEWHNHRTDKFYCGDSLPEVSITEVVNE